MAQLSRHFVRAMATNKRIVVVGGVAGGMSAAARARRLDENATITIFEKVKNFARGIHFESF
jgi:NADPH-dependent 2,4-dienoyl-CoA reductase/sulfur reductase-like enzyme